jgi:hypothetical protein
MRLLERCDAIRQSERFALVLQACECDARGRLGFEDAAYPQAARLLERNKRRCLSRQHPLPKRRPRGLTKAQNWRADRPSASPSSSASL